MIIALVAELNGANRRALNYALGALLLAKVTHMFVVLVRVVWSCANWRWWVVSLG